MPRSRQNPGFTIVVFGQAGEETRWLTAVGCTGLFRPSPAQHHREPQCLDLTFQLFERPYGVGRDDARFHAADRSRFALTYEAVVHTARASTTGTGAAQVVPIHELGPDGLGEHSDICGCLPGAVGTSGAECSSVVVSLREGIEPWQEAATLVHELGHFAGITHTPRSTREKTTCPTRPSAPTGLPTVSPTQRALFRSPALYAL